MEYDIGTVIVLIGGLLLAVEQLGAKMSNEVKTGVGLGVAVLVGGALLGMQRGLIPADAMPWFQLVFDTLMAVLTGFGYLKGAQRLGERAALAMGSLRGE